MDCETGKKLHENCGHRTRHTQGLLRVSRQHRNIEKKWILRSELAKAGVDCSAQRAVRGVPARVRFQLGLRCGSRTRGNKQSQRRIKKIRSPKEGNRAFCSQWLPGGALSSLDQLFQPVVGRPESAAPFPRYRTERWSAGRSTRSTFVARSRGELLERSSGQSRDWGHDVFLLREERLSGLWAHGHNGPKGACVVKQVDNLWIWLPKVYTFLSGDEEPTLMNCGKKATYQPDCRRASLYVQSMSSLEKRLLLTAGRRCTFPAPTAVRRKRRSDA